MREVEISKGTPILEKITGAPLKWPWNKMEVGDSFYSPKDSKSMSAAAVWYGKRHGKKFTIRKEGTGSRVWRIA